MEKKLLSMTPNPIISSFVKYILILSDAKIVDLFLSRKKKIFLPQLDYVCVLKTFCLKHSVLLYLGEKISRSLYSLKKTSATVNFQNLSLPT